MHAVDDLSTKSSIFAGSSYMITKIYINILDLLSGFFSYAFHLIFARNFHEIGVFLNNFLTVFCVESELAVQFLWA